MASQDQTSNNEPFIVDESRWEETSDGYKVYKEGTKELITCPKCAFGHIVYNGNHFCSRYVSGDCNWALPHPVRLFRDREICGLIGIDYH